MSDVCLKVTSVIPSVILDSMNDGLYVCDKDRRITYWSKSAERITGWMASEVVGRRCSDGVLCHVDKDGRRLCGHEFCPLHRSMVTDKPSTVPMPVFGLTRTGTRTPMLVSVAPIHNEAGEVVGGVETFSDYSQSFQELKRAQRIQRLSMEEQLPHDDRISFWTAYIPQDLVGGDFVAVRALNEDCYGFLIADVVGHGIASALYTMNLGQLWRRYFSFLEKPTTFARLINRELCKVVNDESFATALCGVVDARHRVVRVASAGGPPMLWSRHSGGVEPVAVSGLPFGMIDDAGYEEVRLECREGDRLLMFTDGAVEIHDASDHMLGIEGLLGFLRTLDYPAAIPCMEQLQAALLGYSDGIRLADDVTLMDISFLPS